MTDPADDTPLDRAVRAMAAAPEDDAARLRFHERLADAELFLLLAEEADGDHIAPQISTPRRAASWPPSTARTGSPPSPAASPPMPRCRAAGWRRCSPVRGSALS